MKYKIGDFVEFSYWDKPPAIFHGIIIEEYIQSMTGNKIYQIKVCETLFILYKSDIDRVYELPYNSPRIIKMADENIVNSIKKLITFK